MFRNHYHYFIAGLPDFFMDDAEIGFPMHDFKNMLQEELRPEDYKLVQLLFLAYDNKTLLNYLNEDYQNHHQLSTFGNDIYDIEFSDEKRGILPSYMYRFVEFYKNEELNQNVNRSWENIITEMYYDYVLKTKNRFLKEWFEFNRNVNNIVIGYNCRKHNINAENQLIGDNMVTQAILKSNAKDFGLSVELPYITEVIALAEKDNFIAREKGLDQLRWEKLEDLTLFDYFTIEVILAYTIKLDIAYRWLELEEETGREMFRKIIDDLKSSFEFSKEFALNGKNK